MNLGRRDSIKSAMLKSLLSTSPKSSSMQKMSTSKSSFKSSKKVVTSSGSKIEVYEAENQCHETSETVGGETTTETSRSAAERYCELDNDGFECGGASSDVMKSLMDSEFSSFMDTPLALLGREPEDDEEATSSASNQDALQCTFGICPEGSPCMCFNDCAIENEQTSEYEETELVEKFQDTNIQI